LEEFSSKGLSFSADKYFVRQVAQRKLHGAKIMKKKNKTLTQSLLEKGIYLPRAPIIYTKKVESKKNYNRQKAKKIEE
jgi:hypothetical protein